MSSIENKVEVIHEFLENRAQLQRVTGFQEIQRVAGEKLLEKGYRYPYAVPVRRADVATALDVIATKATRTTGYSARPGGEVLGQHADARIRAWATNAGLMEGTLESCGTVRSAIRSTSWLRWSGPRSSATTPPR